MAETKKTADDAAANPELDAANAKIAELQAALDAATTASDAAEVKVGDLQAALDQANTDNARLVGELSTAHAERDSAKDVLAKFDHDGDGKPGGSLPRHVVHMRHPDGIGASHDGVAYEPNKKGVIEVPAAAIDALASHGFQQV